MGTIQFNLHKCVANSNKIMLLKWNPTLGKQFIASGTNKRLVKLNAIGGTTDAVEM